MSGTGDVDHIEIVFLDQPIEVRVNEVEARRRAPMSEKAWLDVLLLERLTQQWIVEQVNLTDRQIVGGAPVSVDERAFGFRQRASGFRRASLFRLSGRHRHFPPVLLRRMTDCRICGRLLNLIVSLSQSRGLSEPNFICETRVPEDMTF